MSAGNGRRTVLPDGSSHGEIIDLSNPHPQQPGQQYGQAMPPGYGPNGSSACPPLPPGFTETDAQYIFSQWVKAPNPAILTAGTRPLLPWLDYQTAEYRKRQRDQDKETGWGKAVETVSAAQITMKIARWLWDLRVPLGELTIGGGREGSCKSQFTVWLAAAVTRGKLPGAWHGQPKAVIIVAREDSWEHTIGPRLWAAGADLSMVYRVEAKNEISGKKFSLTLPHDNERLEKEITRLDAALVIFDPLLSALSPDLNTHRAGDVRAAIEPLAEMAHKTGCAMFGLAHFAKTEGRDAASLISGSHAFKDVARSILVFALDDDGSGVMSHVKSNLGRKQESVAYHADTVAVRMSDGTGEVPRWVYGGETRRHVEDMLDTRAARQVSQARDFLRGLLTMTPWMLSKDVEDAAKAEGISERTLNRARKELGIHAHKSPDGKWWLSFQ